MLIVGLMRLPFDDVAGGNRIDSEPAPATALALGEILVERQIIPARGKHRPVGQCADGFQGLPHFASLDERVPTGCKAFFHHDRPYVSRPAGERTKLPLALNTFPAGPLGSIVQFAWPRRSTQNSRNPQRNAVADATSRAAGSRHEYGLSPRSKAVAVFDPGAHVQFVAGEG